MERSGQRPRRRGADARRGACADRCLHRRASRRAAVLQAEARPCRYRGAGAPKPAAERTGMSDLENFIARWSRRKRAATEETAQQKSAALPQAAAQHAGDIAAQDDSPPPCGEASGVGVATIRTTEAATYTTPHPSPPPPAGRQQTQFAACFECTSSDPA